MSGPSTKLLSFLAPGFLHNLGNSILTIQGRAHLLAAAQADLAATQGQILSSCDRSRIGMSILRAAIDDIDSEVTAVGPLLVELFGMMRVQFREVGIAVDVRPDLADAGHRVPLGALVRAVGGLGCAVRDAIPAGLRGKLAVSWVSPLLLEIRLSPDRTHLPFRIDMTAIAAVAGRSGIVVAQPTPDGEALQLRLETQADS